MEGQGLNSTGVMDAPIPKWPSRPGASQVPGQFVSHNHTRGVGSDSPLQTLLFTFSKLPIDIGIGVKLDFWFSGAGDHKFWKLVCHLRDARDSAQNVLQIISCSTSNLLLNRIKGYNFLWKMQIMLTYIQRLQELSVKEIK